MTLNASGPLSFGGATTGQSINLELGVSATALASINSTSFRTLANVPSGQISVSNFYGKSNSFGWISYISGSGNQTSTSGGAFFADPSGNTYFAYKGNSNADYNSMARINSSGTTATYSSPWADSFLSVNIPAHSTLYTGDAGFWANARISDLYSYPTSILNSSLGYASGKVRVSALSYPTSAAITPDGRVYMLGRAPGKQLEARVICMGQNGSNLGGWLGVASNGYESAVCPRTDNSACWGYKTGQQINMAVLPAGGGAPSPSKSFNYSWSDGGYRIVQMVADSSNNMYSITSQGRLFKADASLTSMSGCYAATGELQGAISIYGSNIYVMTTNSSYTGIILRCYNTSLTPQWVNNFTFSGTSTNMSGPLGRMMATAQGVFMMVDNNTLGNFIMKVPLTGVPSNSSKALTAPSGLTLNWTTGSFSVTSLAFGSITTSTNMNANAHTLTATSIYPAGSTTAPANTNTPI